MERIQKNKKKTVTGILLAAVVVTVMFAAYVLGQRSVENTNTNGIAIEENVSDWDGSLKNVAGNESTGIKIPGYGQLTVDAGEKDWNITLVNLKDNNCYFQYSITIGDEETPIYESDYIEPGKAITEFEVADALDAGEYDMYLNIATYSMDGNNTRLNGASVKADLLVVD